MAKTRTSTIIAAAQAASAPRLGIRSTKAADSALPITSPKVETPTNRSVSDSRKPLFTRTAPISRGKATVDHGLRK
ncbi:hypothetical protein D3C72_2532770 [compost metagenome]